MTTWSIRPRRGGPAVTVQHARAWDAVKLARLVGPDGHVLAFGEVRCERVDEETPASRRGPAVPPQRAPAAEPILNGKHVNGKARR